MLSLQRSGRVIGDPLSIAINRKRDMNLKQIPLQVFAVFFVMLCSSCAHQTNPQRNVDTSVKDDLVQLGPNLFQILRKSEFSGFPELKRSIAIAAAKKCVPMGKEVQFVREEPGLSMGVFVATKELLVDFRCI
jgi:hypothetical protein